MINLCLVIHNHQPIDNNPDIIEKIYSESYLPFIKLLSETPSIKTAVHYTGYLLEWLAKSHPEFIEMLRSLIQKNQIEILSGGYYEPILSVLPENDAIGQINKMSKLIKDLFGNFPNGAWLAERVWEPYLPEILEKSGVKYSFLDDTLFTKTGLLQSDCFAPYLIESRGHYITVFPMLKPLRYLIPFKEPKETISFLKESSDQGLNRIAVFGDDGEKFGAWPETYDLVYRDGWLKNFYNLINSNKWIRTVTPSEYLSSIGKIKHFTYLPTGSYEEMMEWSLIHKEKKNKESDAKNTGGGFWRLFLSKYIESRRMYLRMLTLSKMLNQTKLGENSKFDKNDILDELWKSQFNDVYWHGVFGGIYLSELRSVAYRHLITAQSMLESNTKNPKYIEITKLPTTIDTDDYCINSELFYVSISSENGGAVTEIDYKFNAVNITDTITRKAEPYHSELKALKQKELQTSSITGRPSSSKMNFSELLTYDKYPKFSFIDYLLDKSISIKEFQTQQFEEIVSLADKKYEVDSDSHIDGKIVLSLIRKESLEKDANLTIKKTLHMERNSHSIKMIYNLVYNSSVDDDDQYTFATELNFGALSDTKILGTFNQPIDKHDIESLVLEYEKLGMTISILFNKKVDVWILPVNTVSKSEAGYENKLQGISIIPHWHISPNKEDESLEIKVTVNQINPKS